MHPFRIRLKISFLLCFIINQRMRQNIWDYSVMQLNHYGKPKANSPSDRSELGEVLGHIYIPLCSHFFCPHIFLVLWYSVFQGNLLHAFAEAFFTGQSYSNINLISPEILEQFQKFHNQLGPFDRVSPERMIVCPDILLAGTVDLIVNADHSNGVTLFDWKSTHKNLSEQFGK